MRQKETKIFGIFAPRSRLTGWALAGIASVLALPVAVILWGVELVLRQ